MPIVNVNNLNLDDNAIRANGFSLQDLNNIIYDKANDNINCRYITPSQTYMDQKQYLSILGFNIRSMNQNFTTFVEEIFHPHNLSIVGLCETRLSDSTEKLYMIPNYIFYANNVSNNKGGVCLFVRNTIICKQLPNLCVKTNHFESIFVECTSDFKLTILLLSF